MSRCQPQQKRTTFGDLIGIVFPLKKYWYRHKKLKKKNSVLGSAHALWTSWMSKYASCNRPLMNLLSLLYEFSYSSFKFIPLNRGILHKYACQPALIWSYCGKVPTTIVHAVALNKRRKLTSWVRHSKCIGSCTCNKVQGCQLQTRAQRNYSIKGILSSQYTNVNYQMS